MKKIFILFFTLTTLSLSTSMAFAADKPSAKLPTVNATATATPKATPTAVPTTKPTETPKATPTAVPTAKPTETPKATPIATPTATPVATPNTTPEVTPEATPTTAPDVKPETVPSVSSEIDLDTAIKFLTENEIMVGDENGNFNAENYMTRAEYAKIVCDFVGENLDLGAEKKYFLDVSDDHWAIDYITKANQAGLLLGYGNNIFGVDDTLTEEQAVTVLCRMLGDTYEDVQLIEVEATEKGGYSIGYIIIANGEGIYIDTSEKSAPATRAKVAKWLYQLYNIKNNF